MTLRRHKITKLGDYRPASRLGLIAQLLVSSEKRIIMEMRLVSSRLVSRCAAVYTWADITDIRYNASSIMQKLRAAAGLLRVVTFHAKAYFLLPS